MAVKGLKERALIRRGYYVQEALNRRISLDENALKRRLVEDEESSQLSSSGDVPQEEPKNLIKVIKSDGNINSPKFRELILRKSGIYPKCSPEIITNVDQVSNKPCVGKIDTEICKTGSGIIGGKYTPESRNSGEGEWSFINFFDTNTDVLKVIQNIYEKSESTLPLNTWINININDLAGDNGKYTSMLVDKVWGENSGTRYKGNKREEIVIKALEKSYPGVVISRYCDGHKDDRIAGQDLIVNYNNIIKHVQVKPLYGSVTKRTEINGQIFYEIYSYQDIIKKYSFNKVEMMAFVNDYGEYILFDYVKNMVDQILNPKPWGKNPPKYVLRFKNGPKKKSDSLKIVEIDELEKLKPEKKLEILKEEVKYYELLINDSKIKIKHLKNEINKLEA